MTGRRRRVEVADAVNVVDVIAVFNFRREVDDVVVVVPSNTPLDHIVDLDPVEVDRVLVVIMTTSVAVGEIVQDLVDLDSGSVFLVLHFTGISPYRRSRLSAFDVH